MPFFAENFLALHFGKKSWGYLKEKKVFLEKKKKIVQNLVFSKDVSQQQALFSLSLQSSFGYSPSPPTIPVILPLSIHHPSQKVPEFMKYFIKTHSGASKKPKQRPKS